MQKSMFRKELVLGIILLFVGASVTPSISIDVKSRVMEGAEMNITIDQGISSVSCSGEQRGSGKWINVTPLIRYIGGSITGRALHNMVFDSNSETIIMFSGQNAAGEVIQETWAYNYVNNTWFLRCNGTGPLPRIWSGMAYDSQADRTLVFGGNNGIEELKDTWEYNFNTNTWTNRTALGSYGEVDGTLTGRRGLSMVYDSIADRTIMYGGDNDNPDLLNETWVYDYNNNTWINMTPTINVIGGMPHCGIKEHNMVFDAENNLTIMFGGLADLAPGPNSIRTNWTYIYDYNTNTWVNRTPSMTVVGGDLKPRQRFSMVYDSNNECVVLFGGNGPSNTHLNDTWWYDLSNNTWYNVNYAMSGGILWGRDYVAGVYDSVNRKTIIHGGYNNDNPPNWPDSRTNETWVFDLNSSNQPPNTPTDPNPANESLCVQPDDDISWYCWDPDYDDLTYDVYFEANDPTPDVLVSNNQSEITYDPGTMGYDTTYYWQIVAWDTPGHSTVGPIWHFTTEGPNNAPNTPSNPDPEDDATDISVNANLSWTGGDPDPCDTVTYDVYFEANDSTPDILVSSNQTETTYNPGTMYGNTQYYWQIIAWDNHDVSTEGPIWSFTTENLPPYTPSNPTPNNHASNVDINADLSWDGGDPDPEDTVTYDVYYGTSSDPPKVASNISDTNYDPGIMEYNTKYYWKIVSWDNLGATATGPLWDFTTGNEPNDPPEEPSNPSPLDGATGVSIDTYLSWDCSDPDGDEIFYDVYLEADDETPDVLVADDITETTFDPGILDYGALYYWQIVAIDEHSASTQGPIWSFTTVENNPPDAPSIEGPDRGIPETIYEFGFTSEDPDGHDIAEYIINWDDDSGEETISGPFGSGEEVFASHSWSEKGTFKIQAKAKDVFGAESDWGEFEVKIPRNRATYNLLFLQLLERFIDNFPIMRYLLRLMF